MRKSTFLKWKLRQAAFISRGLLSTNHVVLAHIIPMRRCNLACGYCNEYDQTSTPVPLEVMKRRIDKLAELGTSIVTISGGEPMMHPELDQIIRYIRSRGIIAGLISNGYYFTPERIKRLNEAGFRTASPKAGLTNGAAARARVISTSAKTAWCTGARSSAAIPARRSKITRWKISSASTKPKNGAPPPARSSVCIRSASSTTG